MALVDVIPMFRIKPLEINPAPTKLVEKPATRQTDIKKITVAPKLDTQTLAPAPAQPNYVEQRKPESLSLTGKYQAYAPLESALKDSSITNPNARMAVIAQMGLESGWEIPEDNNYGNITTGEAWEGKSNERGDHDAQGKPIKQSFRSYDSTHHFVNDYVSLLKKQYPTAYKELISPDFNIDRFTSGLVDEKFKYAQDPKYKEKVKGTYNEVVAHISRNKQ